MNCRCLDLRCIMPNILLCLWEYTFPCISFVMLQWVLSTGVRAMRLDKWAIVACVWTNLLHKRKNLRKWNVCFVTLVKKHQAKFLKWTHFKAKYVRLDFCLFSCRVINYETVLLHASFFVQVCLNDVWGKIRKNCTPLWIWFWKCAFFIVLLEELWTVNGHVTQLPVRTFECYSGVSQLIK